MTKKIISRLACAAALATAMVPGASIAGSGGVEKTTGFVCPVFNDGSQAGAKNPNSFNIADGDTSILPGTKNGSAPKNISIPTRATNGGGTGSPGGTHSSTGDKDYTAIWNTGG